MDKLIQTIQDEINKLMESKNAKLSDKRLEALDKSIVASKTVIEKIICEYYESKNTLRQICVGNGVSLSTFKKQRKAYGLEITTRAHQMFTQTPMTIQEKLKDLESGMTLKEYQLKWDVLPNAYYRLKRKLKKDLVD